MKKNRVFLWISCMLMLGLSSCSMPFLVQNYESASNLEKGKVELKGHFARELTGRKVHYQSYGLRVGYGISDRIELRLRGAGVERCRTFANPKGFMLEASARFRVGSSFFIAPALSHYHSRFYLIKFSESYADVKGITGVGVNLIHGKRFNQHWEGTIAFHGGIGITKHGIYPMLGPSANLGFSSNLDRWAIRPSVGVISTGITDFDWVEKMPLLQLNVGLGASFFLDFAKRPKS